MHAETNNSYAESVMLGLLSLDGSTDLSIRLARFPSKNKAEIWIHLATPEGAWSLVDDSFQLTTNLVTEVTNNEVSFSASRTGQHIQFHSTARDSKSMRGQISGQLLLVNTRHPINEQGSIPFSFDLAFSASSEGFRSKSNRWELTGLVQGIVKINGEEMSLSESGKWHEQVGNRPKFAPAFTYLNLQNDALSLLAIKLEKRSVGYVRLNGKLTSIENFTIEAHGDNEHQFHISFDGGKSISGVTSEAQQWSVPIEGVTRPGSSVLVNSNFGTMTGTLNKWHPKPKQ